MARRGEGHRAVTSGASPADAHLLEAVEALESHERTIALANEGKTRAYMTARERGLDVDAIRRLVLRRRGHGVGGDEVDVLYERSVERAEAERRRRELEVRPGDVTIIEGGRRGGKQD